MSEDAAPGTTNPLILVEQYQLLSSEFELRTNSLELQADVRAMAPRAQQHIPVRHHYVLTARTAEDEFRIGEEGGVEDFELTAFYAARNLVSRMHQRALTNLPDHVSLRAAIGMRAGRAFLLAGAKGAGKTTLALRLMFEGYDIAGDDRTLLQGGKAVAFPWKFLVSDSSLELVPQLQAVHGAAPVNALPGYDYRFATDPVTFGRPWHIAPAEVGTILFLEPNFGTRTEIIRTGKIDMARLLIPTCAPPPSRRAGWLGDLSRTIDSAETFVVQLGDLDTAVVALKRIPL